MRHHASGARNVLVGDATLALAGTALRATRAFSPGTGRTAPAVAARCTASAHRVSFVFPISISIVVVVVVVVTAAAGVVIVVTAAAPVGVLQKVTDIAVALAAIASAVFVIVIIVAMDIAIIVMALYTLAAPLARVGRRGVAPITAAAAPESPWAHTMIAILSRVASGSRPQVPSARAVLSIVAIAIVVVIIIIIIIVVVVVIAAPGAHSTRHCTDARGLRWAWRGPRPLDRRQGARAKGGR